MPSDSHIFHDRKLTLGAVRILERIRLRTETDAAQPISMYRQLLEELLREENQATALLELPESASVRLKEYREDEACADVVSFAEWQMTLLRHADRFAIRIDEDAITGTEHLLLASLQLDTWISNFLAEYGIEFEQLLHGITPEHNQLELEQPVEIVVNPAGVGAMDEPTLQRILDASANRCREGLRVVEDFTRFGLDDAFLSRELKVFRHRLTEVLRHLKQENWIPSRDTTHDVGTQITNHSESFRGTTVDVVRASMKRVEEALRSLEEYSKLIDVELSRELEASRYLFYTIEKGIEANMNSRRRLLDRRLYLLVTAANCRYGIETTVRDTLEKGVDIVQLREKRLTDRELIDLGKKVREWTHAHNALFIMNDRPDLAVACGADGVHLGQTEMAVHEARKIVGSRLLVGVSTHHIAQVRDAIYAGADYLGVGPTFPSQTKQFESFPGLDFIAEVAQETTLPWFAIGGIDLTNVMQVLRTGATRIAVSGTICGAADPRGVTRGFVEKLAVKSQSRGKCLT